MQRWNVARDQAYMAPRSSGYGSYTYGFDSQGPEVGGMLSFMRGGCLGADALCFQAKPHTRWDENIFQPSR